jgi:hypothetical protein
MIPHPREPRKRADSLGDALREVMRAIAVDVTTTSTHPSFARLSEVGLTPRQIPTLRKQGVEFAKIGKYWLVDMTTFRALVAGQQVRAEAPASPPHAIDALADVDPRILAAFKLSRGAR